MLQRLEKKYRLWIRGIVLLSLLIPLGIVSYEMLVLGKEAVVFFEHYPTLLAVAIVCYYVLLIILGIGWLLLQLKALWTLKQALRMSELQHLQYQVHPHFFFNMLNNLYGWVGKDPEKARAIILKLSEVMRYSIYEGDKNLVSIEEEVNYLKQFIELHQMRYHKTVTVSLDIQIANNTTEIHPLLLMVLVENAFKHGVETLREGAFVTLSLKSDAKELVFEIENNFDPESSIETGGVGLQNLKRRLALVYPNAHRLDIYKETDRFKAQLHIQL